jgi:hypothetical protein
MLKERLRTLESKIAQILKEDPFEGLPYIERTENSATFVLPNCTVIVKLNPVAFTLVGDTTYQDMLDKNRHLWSLNKSVMENLNLIFENSIITNFELADYSCGICLCYQLDTCPEISCQACFKPFHSSCLKNWFKQLTSARILFGACPYCSATITFHL